MPQVAADGVGMLKLTRLTNSLYNLNEEYSAQLKYAFIVNILFRHLEENAGISDSKTELNSAVYRIHRFLKQIYIFNEDLRMKV